MCRPPKRYQNIPKYTKKGHKIGHSHCDCALWKDGSESGVNNSRALGQLARMVAVCLDL
jgi:hypothetical protein